MDWGYSIMTILSFEEIRTKIDESNRNSVENNRNLYPIQEQATLIEIWENVNYLCEDSSCCNKYNRNHHWKLKNGLMFNDIVDAYLRMFVDSRNHKKIINILKQDYIDYYKLAPRIRGAVESLIYLRDNWGRLYNKASNNMKTLLCNDWCDEFWKKEFNFPISESVYKAKRYSILLPNICIPYDTASKKDIIKFLGVSNKITYYEMLQKLRLKVIEIMDNEKADIVTFQLLDEPAKAISFDDSKISLKRADVNYGQCYYPLERPITRIIDKMFYKPTVD